MRKEIFQKKVGERLIELRKKAGLSQKELALRCDKDKQTIHKVEKGIINPSSFFLYQLSLELNVPVKDLLDFE